MASGTQVQGKLLDYEQFIDHQIGEARARIKLTDVGTAVLTLIASVLGVLFLEVVLDHLFGLPLVLRQVLLVLGLAAAGTYFVWRILRPLLLRVNSLYAARTIEQTDGHFKNSLISYLDFRRRRDELPKAALAAVENRAVNDLADVDIDHVVNQQRLVRMVYVLCAVVVVFCVYAWLTPKSILDSARRALLADVVRPTNTQLLNIKPGDDPTLSKVVAGSNVVFSTDLRGSRPAKVRLHFSTDGGRFYAMRELQPGRGLYDAWTLPMPNVQQSLDYYLTGGDAESRRYRLAVLPAPMVTAVEHDKQFPAYTGFAPSRTSPRARLKLWKGPWSRSAPRPTSRRNRPAWSSARTARPA